MSFSTPVVCRAVASGIAAGAFGGAMLFGSAAIAVAEPSPNCTAAVNAFFTGLKGQDRDVMRDNTQNYLNANPLVQSDLQGIRQPLVDFKAGCQ